MILKLCLSFSLLCFVQSSIIKNELNATTNGKIIYDLDQAEVLFKKFIIDFSKQYKDENEYESRLKIFKKNLEDINMRNKMNDEAIFGITEFSDESYEEFVKKHTGFRMGLLDNNVTKENFVLKQYISVPEQWDWRQKGWVGAVRHQGNCMSCWAFAATGVVYGQLAKKYGKQILLSPQQLVDCFPAGGGCRTGSFPHLGFNAAAQVGGFMSEADYPYRGRETPCQFQRDKVVVSMTGGSQLRVRDEEYLKQVVYEYGPVAIGIYAGMGWLQYRGNIATEATLTCNSVQHPNHAVLLIGYGVERGIPYWIIQNSAGRQWGEGGYIRLVRGRNTCNLMEYAAIAKIA